MNPTHDGQDVYLEPAVEINREAVDPLGATLADSSEVVFNICGSGGC
jgi:hypothetical protein